MLIIGGTKSGKTNWLFNLINYEQDIVKIYLYAKDPYRGKYQLLINKRESSYWILKLSRWYLQKIWIILSKQEAWKIDSIWWFDGNMLINKKFNTKVTELFRRRKKLNIYLVFIAKSYFAVSKNIKLKSSHFLIV